MSALFDINPIYLVYIFVAASAIFAFEGVYLLCFAGGSYRKNVNRRLQLLDNKADRESILVQLRRERGLTGGGDYEFSVVTFNRLVLQSGLTFGLKRFIFLIAIGAISAFIVSLFIHHSFIESFLVALFSCTALPYLVLRILRGRRQKKFGTQFPDSIDIIVRSLRAGHPVSTAITMVAREQADPIGTEFGIVADEVTYGADLETAMRNLYFRVGQEDLPLFVTAVAIQSSTGGNLGEILENLSSVIRERFKMRRKIRSLAAEGRASAMILSSLPIAMFGIINFVSPGFYSSVWNEDLTKVVLAIAGGWMGIGNFIMYRLVNFRI
jgi:tight adherence protein B